MSDHNDAVDDLDAWPADDDPMMDDGSGFPADDAQGQDFFVEDQVTGAREKCNDAIYTFVAVDQNGGPIQVPELIPESDEEKERFEAALRRKQLSLILAGKMKPSDASELKRIFA